MQNFEKNHQIWKKWGRNVFKFLLYMSFMFVHKFRKQTIQWKHQNLPKSHLTELRKLEQASGTSIMITQSDKDHKIVIVNIEDYKRIPEITI